MGGRKRLPGSRSDALPTIASNARHGMHTYMAKRIMLVSASPSIQWKRLRATPTAISAKTGRMSMKSAPIVILRVARDDAFAREGTRKKGGAPRQLVGGAVGAGRLAAAPAAVRGQRVEDGLLGGRERGAYLRAGRFAYRLILARLSSCESVSSPRSAFIWLSPARGCRPRSSAARASGSASRSARRGRSPAGACGAAGGGGPTSEGPLSGRERPEVAQGGSRGRRPSPVQGKGEAGREEG